MKWKNRRQSKNVIDLRVKDPMVQTAQKLNENQHDYNSRAVYDHFLRKNRIQVTPGKWKTQKMRRSK